ncbi:MAG: WD40 repeat domain-containing protein [Candidatus Poribacteria bacterium]|nr:WD40 repeat domain-containing protein [Candidatus Poribacteria bacterium]
MKTKNLFTITILMLIYILFISNGYAQDHTQRNLPEGAIARFGKGKLNGVQLSPDGNVIAVGSSSGVWLYDANVGTELAMFTDHTSQFGAVAFSPNGKTIASGSFGDILLWNTDTGDKLKSFKNDKGRIKNLSFTEDGKTLQCKNHIDSYKLWDISTGKKVLDYRPKSLDSFGRALKLLSGNDHTASDLFLSKNNKGIYARGYDNGKIRLEDASTGKLLKTFQGYKDYIHQLVFSPDGNLLVSNISSDSLRIWDVNTGQQIEAVIDDPKINGILMFSKDGKTLVCQRRSNELVLWDVATKSHRCSLDIHIDGTIKVLSFSEDSKKIIGASSLGEIRIWNTNTGDILQTYTTGHTQILTSLALSPDGSQLASGDIYSIRVWNTFPTYKLEKHINAAIIPQALVFSPEGNTVTSVERFKYTQTTRTGLAKEKVSTTLNIWDTSTGRNLSDYSIESYKETKVQNNRSSSSNIDMHSDIVLSQNGYMLATAQNVERATEETRFTVLIWDVPHGKINYTLKGHTDKIKALSFTPNGKILASGGEDGTIRLWDVNTGTQLFNLPSGKTRVLALSTNGKILATTNSPFRIHLWDIENSKQMPSLQGNNGTVETLAFSPDSKILASGGRDGKIRLWDITINKQLTTVKGHTTDIKELTFSADGKTLASGSSDGLVFLWDIEKVCGDI